MPAIPETHSLVLLLQSICSLSSLWNAPPQISTRLLSLVFSNHFSNFICSTRPTRSMFLIKKHAQLSQLHITSSLGFNPVCVCVCVCAHTHTHIQLCLPLCNSMHHYPPGSPVHGIFQARILRGAAISYPRGSPRPRDRTLFSSVSPISEWILYHCCHQGNPSGPLLYFFSKEFITS